MAQVVPDWVTEPNAEITIRVGKEGISAIPPRTIPDLIKGSFSKFGSNKAWNVKRAGKWEYITITEMYEQCMRVAKSLLAVGLKRFEGVSIMGFNSPEWIMAELGTIMAGGLATGIYTTNNVETTKYILENSGSHVAIGEHSLILEKLLEAGKGIEGMKFVQYSPVPVEQSQRERGVISWEEFLQLGKDVKTEDVEAIISTQKPGQCTNLVYTSGTTGMPKGVMLCHDNMTWFPTLIGDVYGFKQGQIIVSYLPFSHLGGQIFDVFLPFTFGYKVYFAESDAMSGSLLNTIKEVEPNLLFGVPRVWELILEKIEPDIRNGKIKIEDIAKLIGLSNADVLLTGAAFTSPEVFKLFDSAGLTLYNIYGTTENSGPVTLCTPNANKVISVGKPAEGTEIIINQPNSIGEGEVFIKTRGNFMGYLKNPEKTAESMDADGWFHSGDIGSLDSEGYLWINGRMKELIVISTGLNVSPIPIEQEMKKELKLCAFCVVVGEAKQHFNMLVTLKSKLSPAGIPTDDLDDEAVGICKSLGVEVNKISEAKESVIVNKYIQDGINRANERAMNHLCLIKKFTILPLNFSINTNELTPTGKLKRLYVVKKYYDVIEKMYA
ncbi:Long-chain-fatty-acid--CoA ligase [Oopsacas minuta]|uniref:long-chain-fatty-acid--CoA ligase n=1 Tax=Oopsacas minuta TaxID=111878 RepID=A0AAV7JZR1_9METZ|nr:Long-chain-fatty-acid--CoA ligase [Oopsacas minuta]